MKKLILMFTVTTALCLAQQRSGLRVDYDYARFAYDDTAGYFELYYSFVEQDFKTAATDSGTFINGSLTVDIVNPANKEKIIEREFHFRPPVTPQTGDLKNKSLIGNLGFKLSFGKYICKLKVKDELIAGRIDTVTFQFEMPAPAADRFSLSDLQLASGIAESENTASAFYKNSYEITPNPSMVFGESLPVIFFYSEIYNTRRSLNSEVLRVDHLLINAANVAVVQKTKYTSRKNDNIVEAGSLNIRKVPTGAYTLRVSVMDTTSKLTVVSSKKLFVFNPGIVDTSRYEAKEGDVLASEFIAYSEQELDDAFEQAKYIARKDEIDTWKKLKDAEAKRQFLYTFWKGRNALAVEDDTRTSKQYYQRVKQANDRFSTIRRQGWRTDRGRVYLIFGEPSEIERYPNEIDSKPYEIWRYNNLEGGVIFVFGDVSGFSEYQLLHSTMRGELRDENWERKVRQM